MKSNYVSSVCISAQTAHFTSLEFHFCVSNLLVTVTIHFYIMIFNFTLAVHCFASLFFLFFFLFYLLLLLLPTQLGKHFWPTFSYVLGTRVDYLSPTLYLTDIIILFITLFYLPKAKIIAVDKSPDALAVAKKNAEAHNVEQRITFLEADVLNSTLQLNEKLDIIVSNPPYVSRKEFASLQKEIVGHEPDYAVTDFSDGLTFYRKIIESSPDYLNENGKIFFNHIPEKILNLFLSVLQPGGKIRHKIGYGQAFGLGSIDLAIEKVTITDSRQIIPIFQEHHFAPIVSKGLAGQKEYIDNQALLWITRILSFDSLLDDKAYILSYPPYSKGFFQTPVPIDMVRRIQKENPGCTTDVIAEKLFPIKKTIDFRVYQEKSLLGYRILNRWNFFFKQKTAYEMIW